MLAAEKSEKAKLLVTGEEGTKFKWTGNLAQGAEVGASSASTGIQITDLKLKRGEDGLMRPSTSSPAIGAAQGDIPVATDIDGQPVFLAKSAWEIGYLSERFPKVGFERTRERG